MRNLSEKEFLSLNAVGVFVPILVGIILGGYWIVVLFFSTYFMPIPLILLYRHIRNQTGDSIAPIKVTFNPGMGFSKKDG